MLETLREYAWDQLSASGEAEQTQRRHAAYLLALAEAAEEPLKGPAQGRWWRRFNDERDNVRAALHWARVHGDVATGIGVVGALWYWYSFALLSEGRAWAEAFLALPAAAGRTPLRAQGLLAAGN